MKYSYIPWFYLSTTAGVIRFDENGIYESKGEAWEPATLFRIGAKEVKVTKKTVKAKNTETEEETSK